MQIFKICMNFLLFYKTIKYKEFMSINQDNAKNTNQCTSLLLEQNQSRHNK